MRSDIARIAAACFALALSLGALAQQRGDWLVLERTERGFPIIALASQEIPEELHRGLLPWMATIEWKYAPFGKGMPEEQLLKRMYALEDEVEAKHGSWARFVLSETGGGVRMLRYYTSSADEFKLRVQAIAQREAAGPKIVSVVFDPSWATQRQTLREVKK